MCRWLARLMLVGVWWVFVPVLSAQIYQVYRPIPAISSEDKQTDFSFIPIEIQLASVVSAGTIYDKEGEAISRAMYGFGGRVLGRVTERIWIGAQVQQLKAHDMRTNVLTPFERREWAMVSKFILTPQTLPTFYVIAGVGRAYQTTQFKLRTNELKQQNTTLLGGMGLSLLLWQKLGISTEYNCQYELKRWENFVLTGPRMRHQLTLALSYQF